MSQLHFINTWRAPDDGPAGFNPLEPSLLFLPDGYAPGQPRTGFVFVHRWGGYPHDPLARRLGSALADQGHVLISQCLRRKGMEGQLMAMPDNDLHDVRLGVDYLAMNGCSEIFIVGEEAGAWSALRYAANQKDPRVTGVCLIDAPPDFADWLAAAVGTEKYQLALREAGVAARQGAGMDYRIDLLPENGPDVTQQAGAFLAWWSPMADTRVSTLREEFHGPLLDIATEAGDPAAALATFAKTHSAGSRVMQGPEYVQCTSGGDELYALLWQPDGTPVDTAVLLMHGLTSSPASPLFQKMAPVLAQHYGVLAVESHRSGWAGHETALLDQDREDLDNWITLLMDRGFKKIVLAGASMGSLSIGRYQSVTQHPNVIALAHLMPTADCPDWFREAAGHGPYDAAVEQARQIVAEGRGETGLIDIDVRQPPPSLSRGRFRWTQRAASWLSWWGPDADSRNSVHIANAKVPVLLLSGTTDSYNDEARFAALKAAAVNAPRVDEIWYEDIDHGLAGAERRTAEDLAAWIGQIS